tara:strand:+ start:683 stop:865 length:183 start_codon:yes stop_codon:yes gene_type:complete
MIWRNTTFQWNNLSRKYSTTPFYCVKKWMKSQGDLGQETELAALERQRRGKKKRRKSEEE